MNKVDDLTIILYCNESPSAETVEDYLAACSQLILAGATIPKNMAPANHVISVPNQADTNKVTILNEAVRQAKEPYILWLHSGETIAFIPTPEESMVYIAKIANREAQGPIYNWQVRLFPNPAKRGNIFTGQAIPDIQYTVNVLNWQCSDQFLTIGRSGSFIPAEEIEKELQCENPTSMRPFWQGMLATEKGNYNAAIAAFRKALRIKELFFWNKLAILNSLANALMEAQHAEEAKNIAEQSLKISENQWAPYLTLHQYYSLKGQWDDAYRHLELYRQKTRQDSSANWDVFLPEAQAAFLMAEIAFGRGNHTKAYRHYQEFFALNGGNISADVLEKLFIYAIELEDQQQAIAYFKAIFGDDVCKATGKPQLLEALTMFADKGWYDFPSEIYRRLVEYHPEDDAIRHGYIRTLVKNNQIEQAQALL